MSHDKGLLFGKPCILCQLMGASSVYMPENGCCGPIEAEPERWQLSWCILRFYR